jgi:hypothetical protein
MTLLAEDPARATNRRTGRRTHQKGIIHRNLEPGNIMLGEHQGLMMREARTAAALDLPNICRI